MRLGFFGDPPQLLIHPHARRRAGIDGEPDRGASQTQRVLHTAREGGLRVALVEQRVVIVELQDERDFAGELGGSRLQEAQRRRVGVTSGFAGQREMVARIVSGGIGREAPRRAML